MTEITVAWLQENLFDKFNAEGSTVRIIYPADERMRLGLVDTWQVLRAVPHAGKSGGVDFWVVWREPGFLGLPPPDGNWQGTMQYVHVTRFRAFRKTDDNLLLTCRNGKTLQVDFLDDDERACWNAFRVQKEKYRDLYDSYYARSAAEIEDDANSL